MSQLATITAPVSRHLDVSDVTRSVQFYRDTLGFTASADRRNEVTLGPARITLGVADRESKPVQSTIFFEVSDVAATHSALTARGAKPTAVDDVNWIKIRMFEVRDPDDNVLVFGRSFYQPNEMKPTGQLRTIMPELPLSDVPAGVAQYRDVLGFSINYQQSDIGVMDRDDVRLLLVARTERQTGIGSAYFYVRDVDALYAELKRNGANVLGEPVSQPWGLREFQVLDLEGNRLSFAQTFE